jgi:hypothetical protein
MYEWELRGDAAEGCTSLPVCPYYWGSSVQKDLHDGKDQCEATFTLRIDKGHCKDVLVEGLKVGIGFNTPADGRHSGNPWAAILYVDAEANEKQFYALAEIFKTSWARVGVFSKIKRAQIVYTKENLGKSDQYGYKYKIECVGYYKLETEPLVTKAGTARFISGLEEGIIYVGKSTINRFNDPDLLRGKWDKPGMSNVYFPFTMNPAKLDWVP